MKQQVKTTLMSGVASVVAALAIMFAVEKVRHFGGGESGARVWFYDQRSKQLYAASRDLIPPDGNDDSRVRAIVVGFQGMGNAEGQLRIAYLEKYSPEFKTLLQRAAAAHAAKRLFSEEIPSPSSDYFRGNTFVKRSEEDVWHAFGTEEARAIMEGWREWSGPAGQSPIISVPPAR